MTNLDGIENVAELLLISGPAETRTSMFAVLKAYEEASLSDVTREYAWRMMPYTPPIDMRFGMPLLRYCLEQAFRAEYGTTTTEQDHTTENVERVLLRLLNRPRREQTYLVPFDESAALRWPWQLRVLVEWCMLVYDWRPHLPAYVVMWMFEWTDAPFNWRGTELQRINAIQRVRESRDKVLAARDRQGAGKRPHDLPGCLV